MRIAIVLFVSGFTGLTLTRCVSAPTTKETIQAVADTDDLGFLIKSSNLSPANKATAAAKVESVKSTLQKQGETIERQAAEISTLAKYKHYVWAFCIGVVTLGAGFFVFKRFF